jgi:hypothetical protein
MAMAMLKRSLKYRISGHNAGWLQNVPVKNISVFNRVDFILDQCRNKKVLHIGFSDYPFTAQKTGNGSLLHVQLQKVTKCLLGLDNNQNALQQYCEMTGDTNVLLCDILLKQDIA